MTKQYNTKTASQSSLSKFYVIIGILQLIGVIILLIGLNPSVSGSGNRAAFQEILYFLAATMYAPLLGVALLNLIGLSMYIKQNKIRGKVLAFSLLSLLASVYILSIPVSLAIAFSKYL